MYKFSRQVIWNDSRDQADFNWAWSAAGESDINLNLVSAYLEASGRTEDLKSEFEQE